MAAGGESDRKGSEADERPSDQFAAWVRLANGLYVIEPSQRNPIVQGQEQHVETLKREQCAHGDGMHDILEFTVTVSVFSLCRVASSGWVLINALTGQVTLGDSGTIDLRMRS